jgi:AcrR family transcriptional regulator
VPTSHRSYFLERGYAGTALEAVAHAADVAPRTA